MKLAILIDYANTFINIKEHLKLKRAKEIEMEMVYLVEKVEERLAQSHLSEKKEQVQVTQRIASVLNRPGLGTPGELLSTKGFRIIQVEDVQKTSEMIGMNQSKDDDSRLMEEGLRLVQSGLVDGVLVFSNDGDFVSLAETVHYLGRYFWVGVYETETQRASARLHKIADKVIPLQEIMGNGELGIPLPASSEFKRIFSEELKGPHLEIHYQGEIIMTYPLDRQVIEIGRRSNSRFHYPHIDLTDYDHERIISRQHAKIQQVGNKILFLVHKECTRGTWREGNIVYPCEQFFLEPRMRIVLGSDRGFGLILRIG